MTFQIGLRFAIGRASHVTVHPNNHFHTPHLLTVYYATDHIFHVVRDLLFIAEDLCLQKKKTDNISPAKHLNFVCEPYKIKVSSANDTNKLGSISTDKNQEL